MSTPPVVEAPKSKAKPKTFTVKVPSLGRLVHYVGDDDVGQGTSGLEDIVHSVATITYVPTDPAEGVSLRVWGRYSDFRVHNVHEDSVMKLPGTFHFPEYVPDLEIPIDEQQGTTGPAGA